MTFRRIRNPTPHHLPPDQESSLRQDIENPVSLGLESLGGGTTFSTKVTVPRGLNLSVVPGSGILEDEVPTS